MSPSPSSHPRSPASLLSSLVWSHTPLALRSRFGHGPFGGGGKQPWIRREKSVRWAGECGHPQAHRWLRVLVPGAAGGCPRPHARPGIVGRLLLLQGRDTGPLGRTRTGRTVGRVRQLDTHRRRGPAVVGDRGLRGHRRPDEGPVRAGSSPERFGVDQATHCPRGTQELGADRDHPRSPVPGQRRRNGSAIIQKRLWSVSAWCSPRPLVVASWPAAGWSR